MADDYTSTSGATQAGSATVARPVRPAALVLLIVQAGAGEALGQVLANIPRDLNAAFLVLADTRRGFSTFLCERLRSECALPVHQLAFEADLAPGEVLVVPAQVSLEFTEHEPGGAVSAMEVALEGERAAESTVKLKEIAGRACALFGASTVAVMLSCLPGDAVEAVRQVREAGGRVITQNAATALLADGSRAVSDSNLADEVLPLWDICSHLTEYLEKL